MNRFSTELEVIKDLFFKQVKNQTLNSRGALHEQQLIRSCRRLGVM